MPGYVNNDCIAQNMQGLKFTGFEAWSGAGSYYTTSVTDFTLDRPGSGYIKGVRITWAGGQTVAALSQGNTHYIYVDDTGTIGSTTSATQTTYEDYIILFEVLVDNDTPANLLVVKENHPYSAPTDLSVYLHNTIGVVISNRNAGANIIAVAATDEVGISGEDFLEDHGLETTIPDSAAAGVSWNFYYTDGGGKWVLDSTAAAFPSVYNNAGTVTALTAGRYGIFRLYVSKDDIESALPRYVAVIDDAQYNNLNLARTAVAAGGVARATNELFNIELAQLGYVIYEQSTASLVDFIIEKGVVRGNTVTSGTDVAALVTTDTTNFDGWLSTADTTVQAALDTLDDINFSAFSVYLNADQTNVTGDGTSQQVLFDAEVFDENDDFNTGTSIFTAPVKGLYQLQATIFLKDVAAAHTTSSLKIITSNRNYTDDRYNVGAQRAADNTTVFDITVLADMDASDTAYVEIDIANGAKVIDIGAGASAADLRTFFSGILLKRRA